ncbi:hypothetical protein SOCEGT47_067960 [Sorangium cellulosum]|jgi:uncharacterized protein (DUF362 family)|uniref:DUF362 domain-containing protein n=1 Tax=Sorangium cellulosum TaxID=56 RepID=A0A4P2Q9H4_SORCE|nr:DUF362 domain-containing protein [Sorangium cellulosum]AUX26235.1 hypothetical protein SOCEGT47_067960 [Sorangium cellulosum]
MPHDHRHPDDPGPAERSRRVFLGGLAAGAAGAVLLGPGAAFADAPPSLAALPPPGFTPLSIPGKVVKVTKGNVMQPNGLWPDAAAAKGMLERAMAELTGKSDLGAAFGRFVHKDDRVAIKANGIAGQKGATMATNKELVLEVVRGVVAAGVPPENIMIFEQYPSFLAGTRCADRAAKPAAEFPAGIRAAVHENKDAVMPSISVCGIPTKFVRPFTEATAVINVSLIKDHSICGYTGCLKNITHGATINPHAFHQHTASPQIAELYAQDVVKSRVRLHITDGFKLIYDQGPLDKNPKRRVLHESVYVTTDPVAMDVIGWGVVETWRKENGLPTLKEASREPSYIRIAGELGLGVFDKNKIAMREVRL